MKKTTLALLAILLVALALRAPVLTWGLPPSTPAVAATGLRCSYAFDEDDVLTAVAYMLPSKLEFDPRRYHWGTGHFQFLLIWMEAAAASRYFARPWREAYYQMIPGEFEKVYAAGRAFSVLAGLASIAVVFLLARDLVGPRAGLAAAALLAVSPVHLLASTQVRVDITMTLWLAWGAWMALHGRLFGAGVLLGLAVVTKYSALFAVAPLVGAIWWRRRQLGPLVAGLLAGVLAGQPTLLTRAGAMWDQIHEAWRANLQAPAEFRLAAGELVGRQALGAVRFVLGPVAAMLAASGLWRMRQPILIAPIAGLAVSLVPLDWPLLRYQVPLLAFLAIAAAMSFDRLGARARWLAGVSGLAFPLAASLSQIAYMLAPHPANRAFDAILAFVPPGTGIARLVREMPPLDEKLYPIAANPYLDDMAPNPPPFVLTADLPDRDYPSSTLRLLETRYDRIAEFSTPRSLAWSTFGERAAPHDWKYTHPVLRLYRRRSP
ncbi:MAG: ArnT family glycosyltransferase [Bryobacteraceae bacterium]